MKYGAGKRSQAYSLFNVGYSCSCVAKQVGVPLATAKKWCKACKANPSLFLRGPRHHKLGNPRANRFSPPLSKRDKRKIVNFVEFHANTETEDGKKKRKGLRRMSRELHKPPFNIDVSIQTISKLAHADGLVFKHRPRKPDYTPAQKRQRVILAKGHLDDDWSNSLFTDEVEVTIDGAVNSRNNGEWTRKPALVKPQPTHKFPKSRKYFVALCAHGALEPKEFFGRLNSEKYQKLLDDGALDGANELFGGHEWRYVHDLASYHTSASSQLHLETAVPGFFTKDEWAVAPDANLAESALGDVQEAIAAACCKDEDELDRAFRQAWREATTPEKLAHLVGSMRERLEAIIKARGGHTRF